MQGTLRLIATETRHPRPGGEAVITRLSDILVIQAIRAWIGTADAAQAGWLGALRDPQIGAALALIHSDPARAWTVAELAGELAMSRSAFAARFTELVGEPVVQYLTRWRMQVATEALREDGATVAELAGALGYRSEAAFARAFKRVVGVAPGAVKREARSEADELELLAPARERRPRHRPRRIARRRAAPAAAARVGRAPRRRRRRVGADRALLVGPLAQRRRPRRARSTCDRCAAHASSSSAAGSASRAWPRPAPARPCSRPTATRRR